MKAELLLHHCCAPCSVRVVGKLEENFGLQSFWFNPNIHPLEENARRRDSLARFAASRNLPLHFGPEYPEKLWLDTARSCGGTRCSFCYSVRLRETAKKARSLGLKYFSTTLLASPYQKHELIREAALAAAAGENVEFYYEDFRPYFFEGKTEARKLGYYLQKYCGCGFSKEERENEKRQAAGAKR